MKKLKSLPLGIENNVFLNHHIIMLNNSGYLKSVIDNSEKVEIKTHPKLNQALKNDVKGVKKAEAKGNNFITRENPAPKSDLNAKI